LLCKEEEILAVAHDPLCPLPLHVCASTNPRNLTLPLSLPRNTETMTFWSTRSSSSMAVMQIRLLGTRSAMPPLVELVIMRCIASSRPHGCGRPPGEPLCPARPLGFAQAYPASAGGRRPGAVDLNLIGRPRALGTASGTRAD
jgi:hypothetical protein